MEPVGEQVRGHGHGGHDPAPAAFRVVVLFEGDQLPDVAEPGQAGRLRLAAAAAGQRRAAVQAVKITAVAAAVADSSVRAPSVAEAAAHARIVAQQLGQAPGTEESGSAARYADADTASADDTAVADPDAAATAHHRTAAIYATPPNTGAYSYHTVSRTADIFISRIFMSFVPLFSPGIFGNRPPQSDSLKTGPSDPPSIRGGTRKLKTKACGSCLIMRFYSVIRISLLLILIFLKKNVSRNC